MPDTSLPGRSGSERASESGASHLVTGAVVLPARPGRTPPCVGAGRLRGGRRASPRSGYRGVVPEEWCARSGARHLVTRLVTRLSGRETASRGGQALRSVRAFRRRLTRVHSAATEGRCQTPRYPGRQGVKRRPEAAVPRRRCRTRRYLGVRQRVPGGGVRGVVAAEWCQTASFPTPRSLPPRSGRRWPRESEGRCQTPRYPGHLVTRHLVTGRPARAVRRRSASETLRRAQCPQNTTTRGATAGHRGSGERRHAPVRSRCRSRP